MTCAWSRWIDPNPQERRRPGKSDPLDAIEAARAAQGGRARGEAKTRSGNVEAVRVLRVARASARKDRTRALNQLRSAVSTGPEELRRQLRGASIYRLVKTAAALRPNDRTDVANATNRPCARGPARPPARGRDGRARRSLGSAGGTGDGPRSPHPLGIGTDTAGGLPVSAGDNPERLRNEWTLAHLWGVSPLDASPGKQLRHRLR
jgi:transposase